MLHGAGEPVRAVDGVDLEIRRGETFAIVGESGCGKTMTALSLMRLLPESGRIAGGTVELSGVDLLALSEAEMRKVRGRKIAMIFQEPATSLNPVLAIGTQIREVLERHTSLRGAELDRRILELLDSVGIPDGARRAEEYPFQLSGGLKQRAMIAMALAAGPDLLIADEPTTAVDVTIQSQVLELLSGLQEKNGMAILLITHDLGVVARMAHRVAVMYAGQIVEVAERERFFAAPQHPYSRKLFEALPTGKRGTELAVIKGQVPPLTGEFRRCRFTERCDFAFERCSAEAPGWTHIGRGARGSLFPEGEGAGGRASKTEAGAALAELPESAPLLSVRNLKVHFPIRQGLFQRATGWVKAVDGTSLEIRPGARWGWWANRAAARPPWDKAILQLVRPTAGEVEFDGVELTQLRGAALRAPPARFPDHLPGPVRLAQSAHARRRHPRRKAWRRSGSRRTPRRARGGSPRSSTRWGSRATRSSAIRTNSPAGSASASRSLAPWRCARVSSSATSPPARSTFPCRRRSSNLLKTLQRELALSYLFITHNIAVVEYLAHEVAVMYLGRIVERGTADEVLRTPKHPYTQALLAAVPKIEAGGSREIIRLEGELPSPVNPPSGCHFHPRCPKAMAECRERYPESFELSGTRSVACWLYKPGV